MLLVIAFIGIYFNQLSEENNEILIRESPTTPALEEDTTSDLAQMDVNGMERPKEGISLLIGESTKEVIKLFGKPKRIDTSSYGYEWWIYDDYRNYLQVGVEEKKVVTIYAIGEEVNISPFKIGQPVDEIYSSVLIVPDISLQLEDGVYRFELSEEDMNVRPLVKIGNIYVQLYLDKFTGTLSSVRFLDGPTLVKQQPYELVYRGTLYEADSLTESDWEKVAQGSEQQIFDITNIIRKRFQLQVLDWDDETAKVAFLHSKDMFEHDYFSHDSPKFGNLSNRLELADIFYKVAGENIAAQYTDGPAAVEGWLNSKGHRDTMLNDEFSHVGIGVYQKYYTQNFIQTWGEEVVK